MSNKCCEYHDALPESWQDAEGPEPMSEGSECGLAGMGTPSVCCRQCPQAAWLIEGRGLKADAIDYAVQIMALPAEQRP